MRPWLVSLLVVAGSANPGGFVVAGTNSEEPKPLKAGVYALSLRASEGSRKGSVVEGSLTLVATSPDDKSPGTGERAKGSHSSGPFLYGWTRVDFKSVGAPMCGSYPPPDSHDPVYPGIAVSRLPYGNGDTHGDLLWATTLLAGTVANRRDGRMATDGCGIAMHVFTWDGRCHAGTWGAYGLRRDGSGTFRICPR